jgi:hypothetical protein
VDRRLPQGRVQGAVSGLTRTHSPDPSIDQLNHTRHSGSPVHGRGSNMAEESVVTALYTAMIA